MIEVEFLFDNQLIAAVESIIKESKNKLLLVSPFIDLDRRIQDALKEKMSKHDFELLVLFGKNENNHFKSMKKDSFHFLKQFPNVEIRFNDRLHAKFYQNDFDFIMTSLNLFDYSLAKNIEVGIKGNYASKGLLGKITDGTDLLITNSVDKVKQGFLGMNQEVNPLEKFQTIFLDSELMYKTEPKIISAGGLIGTFGVKKLEGFEVKVDKLSMLDNSKKSGDIISEVIKKPENNLAELKSEKVTDSKTISASQLSKKIGVSAAEINRRMHLNGLIDGDSITSKGYDNGLEMKNYMGKSYIAYPENLKVLENM